MTSTKIRKIVLLARTARADQELLDALSGHADVHVVRSVDDAAAALRSSDFDLAIAESSDLLALARSAGELQTEAILESIGQAVCVVNRDGELTWANQKLRSYPEPVLSAIRDACSAICRDLASGPIEPTRSAQVQKSFHVGREYAFDLTGSALLSEDGRVERFVAIVWDVSAARRLTDKLNAIDNAGRDLLGLDADTVGKMDAPDRLRMLEEKVIAYCRDLLDFDHLIVRVLDAGSGRLEAVMASGLSEDARSLEIRATADGNGISGYVAATGRSYICPDITHDPRYLPGLESARSSLTVPLKLQQRVIGVMNVESDRVAAFTEDDRQLAEIFARYIAMGLQVLQLLVGERYATTGQVAADVDAELAGPLNDIICDVTAIIEAHGQDEDLRRRLQGIIHDVDRVKQAVHRATDPRGVCGFISAEPVERDPILRGKRILIADDEDIIRETVAEVLSKYGALTVMAKDGAEACALARQQSFDLVLSDIKMPNRNGYEVFSDVRAATPTTPVILITGFGYDPNHSIVRASKEGLNGVLFKPFKVDQLLEEVRAALSGAPA